LLLLRILGYYSPQMWQKGETSLVFPSRVFPGIHTPLPTAPVYRGKPRMIRPY